MHRVRTHTWRVGRLEIKDRMFENFDDAMDFAQSFDNAHSIKIFDGNDSLTHHITPSADTTESYA